MGRWQRTLLVIALLVATATAAQAQTATATPTPVQTPPAPATDASKCIPFHSTTVNGGLWLRQNPGYSLYSVSIDKTAGTGTIVLEGKDGWDGAIAALKSCTDDCTQGGIAGPWQYIRVNTTACSSCVFAGAYCGAAP